MQLTAVWLCYYNSMPTLYSDIELNTRDSTVEEINNSSRPDSTKEEQVRSKVQGILPDITLIGWQILIRTIVTNCELFDWCYWCFHDREISVRFTFGVQLLLSFDSQFGESIFLNFCLFNKLKIAFDKQSRDSVPMRRTYLIRSFPYQ